jgi:retron-type reverse transcriptase
MAEKNSLSMEERRERLRKYGRELFIQEEMVRLGFWPEASAGKQAEALQALKTRYDEIIGLRDELAQVEAKVQEAQDIEAQLKEIRRQRIERVRSKRELRKLERAKEAEEKREADQKRCRQKPPFLGQGVSAGLHYEGGEPEKLAALGLPKFETASDLAQDMGIDESKLAWLTYHRGAATIDHYHRFTIPKRSGGLRVISSPKSQLRQAQSWLLETVLSKLAVHEAAMAFRPGRSILDNAKLHTGQAIVIRIDLKDFFPSITFKRVKGLFESFGYNSGVASIMALIATEAPRLEVSLNEEKRYVSLGERQLPQGACTSPAITNLLCRNLDKRLSGLAKKFGFKYTRYADDCVFSHTDPDAPLGRFLGMVRKVFQDEGFVVNEDKTRIMRPQHRQTVTGLVVNQQPSISRTDLKRFRSFLHHFEKEGPKTMSERIGKNAWTYAKGYLSYIQMVSPAKAEQLKKAHPWLVA